MSTIQKKKNFVMIDCFAAFMSNIWIEKYSNIDNLEFELLIYDIDHQLSNISYQKFKVDEKLKSNLNQYFESYINDLYVCGNEFIIRLKTYNKALKTHTMSDISIFLFKPGIESQNCIYLEISDIYGNHYQDYTVNQFVTELTEKLIFAFSDKDEYSDILNKVYDLKKKSKKLKIYTLPNVFIW